MFTNSKKIIFFLVSIIILFSLGWYEVKSEKHSILGRYIPNNIKTFLKNTIFLVPQLQTQIDIKDKKISKLLIEKIKTLDTWNAVSNDMKNINARKISSNKLIINKNVVKIDKFLLPIPDYFTWGKKSVGYIEQAKDNFFFISGDGKIFYFEESEILKSLRNKNEKLKLSQISSNFTSFADKELIKTGKLSVKDILINNNKILISFINKKKKNCHNTEIISGEINLTFISFSNFFTYDECYKNGNVHSSGGRMINFNNDEILFTIGEGLNRSLAQNKDSLFGKIIKINTDTKKYKIISMGHRNPQGIHYNKKDNRVIATEHGPSGGDEINIIKFSNTISNYGWPISSYGNHYPGQINKYRDNGNLDILLKEAPLHKSHSKYSFEEPLKYFTPSIGISEIIMIDDVDEITSLNNYYFVASMGDKVSEGDMSLHYFKIKNQNQIFNYEKIPVGERIRDLLYDKKNKFIIMVLENSPALGFVSIN